MRLEFAFLADAATITPDGQFAVVGGGLDLIQAHSFPTIKSAMVLVGRIVFSPDEFGRTHLLLGEIVAPGGISLPPQMWLSLKPFPHFADPKRENWLTICLNYQGVGLPTPGTYSIRLSSEKAVIGELKFDVFPLGAAP